MRRARASFALLALVGLTAPVSADDPLLFEDDPDDCAPRRTDAGALTPFDADRLPELIQVELGCWAPSDPGADVFVGEYNSDGLFLRIDVLLAGLVPPPGPTDPAEFDPFDYGSCPAFGFIEIDMDHDVETGGELAAPEFRYLGNVARFGGWPDCPVFTDRLAADASAFDGDFGTPPYVERHGEDFHLALLGTEFVRADIQQLIGDGNYQFEVGEEWQVNGQWLHRAHGYEAFSLALGGSQPGEYMPRMPARFAHDPALDRTRLSVVFPLTNLGAALMIGEPLQPMNGDPSDQASVYEALLDLYESALFLELFPTGLPEEALILGWAEKEVESYLELQDVRLTAVLGTSYSTPPWQGTALVWTDVWPNPARGDVNGDGAADEQDRSAWAQYLAVNDEDDGQTDGRVVLADFARNFDRMDLNHNGVVDELDWLLISRPADLDLDEDVDLADFAAWQECAGSEPSAGPAICGLADLDADDDVDDVDARRFLSRLNGPD